MEEIYQYMKMKLREMYESEERTVQMDGVDFMRIFKVVCDMLAVKKIVEHS